ncbi:MAG TPA: BatA domain-containing protein [Candidatus Binatia bacterium]
MEFLNPTALYAFFALPLLLIPYLIKKRPQSAVFSSLLLFADFGARARVRPWGRLRLPPVFFLQLLLLAVLILALGEPVSSVKPTNIAILLDNSASMQAIEGGRTRFDLAREKARDVIDGLGASGKVDLYRTVPAVARMTQTPLTPPQAVQVLSKSETYDIGDAPVDYSNVLGQLAREGGYDRVYFITDHPARGEAEKFRVITVGKPAANLAITALQINPGTLVNSRMRAVAEIANYSGKDERVRIVLKSGETVLANHDAAIAAGKTGSVTFEGIGVYPSYEAIIDRDDALPLDNHRFAVAPKARSLRILAISPRPQALASIREIPGVTLDTIEPANYSKAEGSKYDLEIFHYASPSVLPGQAALFILPPSSNPLVQPGNPSRAVVSSWREPHTLTKYVNFSLFRPTYIRPLKPRTPGESIVETADGPLVLAVERDRVRYLVLGFDPFPYLGRQNLPMSIFTLNALDWFYETSGNRGFATGERLDFGTTSAGESIVTPRGERIVSKGGVPGAEATSAQGLYQLNRGGERQWVAFNLTDARESDLRESSTVDIRKSAVTDASASSLFSLWPYLLAGSLVLLILEWFISPKLNAWGRRRVTRTAFSHS